MNLKKLLPVLTIICFAVILRLFPHPANFAPITALALFGGTYLNKKYALIIPLVAMFISDVLIGFHDTMFFVYLSFLISGLFGLWLKNKKTIGTTVLVTLLSSLQFFFITNFGVWLVGSIYAKTIEGLLEAYVMGIPFYRNTLLGDLFYTAIFFSAYEVVLHSVKISTSSRSYMKK